MALKYITDVDNSDEYDITFKINSNKKLKTGFVNGLRRIMLSDIPIHCISSTKINFIENTSVFNDDVFIKRRLCLSIIKNNTLKDFDDIIISANKTNETDEMISVYLSDFTITQRDKEILNKDFFHFPKSLITKLKPDQTFNVEATVECGLGRMHAKYSPVSSAFYHFEYDKDERVYETDKDDYPMKYIFTIESSGQLPSKQLMMEGIQILKNKLLKIKNDLLKKTGKITEIKKSPTELKGIDIHIIDENDTIGNLITQYILDTPDIIYSGYHMPHPLKKLLILRCSYKDSTEETIVKLISNTIDKINVLLDDFSKDCGANL